MKEKKHIAFFDLVVYAIVCTPLIALGVILAFVVFTEGNSEPKYKWYFIAAVTGAVVIPLAGRLMFRLYFVEPDQVFFHYFPFATGWKKATENIDISWNQYVFIAEVESVEIVKLTKEEKKTKVYYRHWFNKYLKINLKYGKCKYVYVGNYANFQIKKIIQILSSQSNQA